jgi:hypothetical protein
MLIGLVLAMRSVTGYRTTRGIFKIAPSFVQTNVRVYEQFGT